MATVNAPSNANARSFLKSLRHTLASGTYQVPLTRDALVEMAESVAERMTDPPVLPDWSTINLKDADAVATAAKATTGYDLASSKWQLANAPLVAVADSIRESISRRADAKAKAAENAQILRDAKNAKA